MVKAVEGFAEELINCRVFIIRGGPPPCKKAPDRFTHSCVFKVPRGSKVGKFVALANGKLTLTVVNEAHKIVKSMGFTVARKRAPTDKPRPRGQR